MSLAMPPPRPKLSPYARALVLRAHVESPYLQESLERLARAFERFPTAREITPMAEWGLELIGLYREAEGTMEADNRKEGIL